MTAATVTVRAKALSDRRFVRLAQLAGYPGGDDEALGKMTRLWALCAELQTDQPEVRHIRACLGPRGEEHLVESGLGDDKHRDPSLTDGVIRVRGCDECDWAGALAEQRARVAGGIARAEAALRDGSGRFTPNAPPEPQLVQLTPASSLSPDSGSGSSDPDSPEHPDLQVVLEAERAKASQPSPHLAPSKTEELRRKLHRDAWNLASLRHAQLKADGIEPHAKNCWSGTPVKAEVEPLAQIIAELTAGDPPDWKGAEEKLRNRIEVAAAEAKRDRTLRWFIPSRMWNAKSFAIGAAMSPEQAAQPRGPRNHEQQRPAEPVRRMRTL